VRIALGVNLQACQALEEAARVLEPGAGLQGAAGFDGRVEGEGRAIVSPVSWTRRFPEEEK
jgi:hypothetical protein